MKIIKIVLLLVSFNALLSTAQNDTTLPKPFDISMIKFGDTILTRQFDKEIKEALNNEAKKYQKPYTYKSGLFVERTYDEQSHLIEKERRVFYFLFKRNTVIEYYCNGKKKLKSHYIQVTGGRGYECLVHAEMQRGIWKYWDENGNLYRKEKFKNGDVKGVKNYEDKQ